MADDTTTPKPLRITQLIARDFKRLESVEIVPGNRSLILLHGPNEHGKTSIIDAFIAAMGGGRRVPEVPVRRGADEAAITIELSDETGPRYRVVRTATGTDSSVRVYDVSEKIPASLKAPQSVLDSFGADFSFDPLKFMRASRDEAMKLLLSAVGMLDQYERYQSQRRGLLDSRKEAERTHAQQRAAFQALPHHPDIKERKSDDEARAAVDAANTHNRQIDEVEAEIEKILADDEEDDKRVVARLDQLDKDIAHYAAMLKDAKADKKDTIQARAEAAEKAKAATKDARDRREKLGMKKTADDMMRAVEEVAAHNRKVDQNEHRAAAEKRVAEAKKAVESIDTQLEELDAAAKKKLESSPIGQAVPGLVVKDNGIYHDDVPIEQASGMRKLELSLLVGMAANPRLRVMCVDEIDRVDDESLKRIVTFCKEHGYQLWGTAVRVTASDEDYALVPVKNGKAKLSNKA